MSVDPQDGPCRVERLQAGYSPKGPCKHRASLAFVSRSVVRPSLQGCPGMGSFVV